MSRTSQGERRTGPETQGTPRAPASIGDALGTPPASPPDPDRVDRAGADSFPGSDPPSWTQAVA